jgi:hypothetical protein
VITISSMSGVKPTDDSCVVISSRDTSRPVGGFGGGRRGQRRVSHWTVNCVKPLFQARAHAVLTARTTC